MEDACSFGRSMLIGAGLQLGSDEMRTSTTADPISARQSEMVSKQPMPTKPRCEQAPPRMIRNGHVRALWLDGLIRAVAYQHKRSRLIPVGLGEMGARIWSY